jgi:hypothetical protein
MNADDVRARLIPLSDPLLDALAWFATWTPAVHQADWNDRRHWPPGFREVADNSVRDSQHEPTDERMLRALPKPLRKAYWGVATTALAFGLIEGTRQLARLTPRGRDALKHAGRACPDAFRSHCATIFDDAPLLVRAPAQDGPEAWAESLREMEKDAGYVTRSTANRAAVSLTIPQGERALNGSLRTHGRYVHFSVHDAGGRLACDFALSFEQFAEMLVHRGEVPCTLDWHVGSDGIPRSEPVPPPISAMDRMQARIERHRDEQKGRIEKAAALVRAAKMGKRAQDEILRELGLAGDLGDANAAFVAEQTLEEISAVVEGARTLVADRIGGGGDAIGILDGRAVARLAPRPADCCGFHSTGGSASAACSEETEP